MGNCTRDNSGMVSHIHLKLVHVLTTKVASRDMTLRSIGQRPRSQGRVTYSVKNGNNPVVGRPINFVVEGRRGDDPPTSRAQAGCYGNDGCLTTGPRNLHLWPHSSKTQMSINFRIGRYIQHQLAVK